MLAQIVSSICMTDAEKQGSIFNKNDSLFDHQNIYNIKAAIQWDTLSWLTLTQTLLQKLEWDNWDHTVVKDKVNQVTHLFFMKEFSK